MTLWEPQNFAEQQWKIMLDEGEIWEIGFSILKLLIIFSSNVHSITKCGWSSV